MSPADLRQHGFTPLSRSAENGFTPLSRSAENGFTLVEMLVALAIFSLAALALLRLEGATVRQTGRLGDQAVAQIVARNLAVEALTDPVAPAFGQVGGSLANGGRTWLWTRVTARSPEPRIQQIEIAVSGADGRGRAGMIVFRRGAQ